MEFVYVRAVHNCATLKSLSTTLFPLSGPFNQFGIPPLRLSRLPPVCGNASVVAHAKKRNSYAQPVFKQKHDTQIEEEDEEEFEYEAVSEDEEEGEDEFEYDEEIGEEEFEYDEEVGEEETEEEEKKKGKNNYLDEGIILVDDDDEDDFDFEVEVVDVSRKTLAGDGEDGGGILLGSRRWEKEALSIAEELSEKSFGDFKIYAFKTSPKQIIYIRIEKLSSKYGSPGIDDIEAFSRAYRERLEEAVTEGRMPPNISFEVSSPGVERVVRIPEELERFKDRPMYVNYITDNGPALSPPIECDGIFSLVSYDLVLGECIWAIADVKANRKAGKGRPLNKKQKELRVKTPFESLRLVRLHSDC